MKQNHPMHQTVDRTSIDREKGRYLTQSYDKSPYTRRKYEKQLDNMKNSITQRLRTDLGLSDGVTAVTPLVWLKVKILYLTSSSSPAYGVFISQLIRYARACSSYECFILRARRLSSKLLKQGYLVERLKSSFRKFYGRYGDLVEQYGVTLSRMLNDILTPDQQ